MTEIVVMILISLGTLFILLAAIGLVRMPDFYLRVSVTTKAATLGVGLVLGGAAVYFNDASVVSRVLAIIIFLLLTAPVAAHMIGRTAYFTGTKLWDRSTIDELKGKYHGEDARLSGNEKTGEKEEGEDDAEVPSS
jgi:multicomponent Na+:H+ antiporter subunit G